MAEVEVEPQGGQPSVADLDAAREVMADLALKEHLREIRRISRLERELKKARESHTEACVPLLKQLGTREFEDPITGSPIVATVIEAETLVVDAGQLLEALVEQEQGDIERAEVIWKDTLKPPAVDTKDGGLFNAACTPTDPTDPATAPIRAETVVKVAYFKKSKGYVSFGKPGE